MSNPKFRVNLTFPFLQCVGIIGGNWDSGNWVKLYNEKRQDLEEQQLHLSVGLQKIRETVEQVEELQASLSIKKNELE